jgi:hypothetical protein
MIAHALMEAGRYRGRSGSGSGYGYYIMVRWLWQLIGWWSIPVWAAIVAIGGFIKGFIKGLVG